MTPTPHYDPQDPSTNLLNCLQVKLNQYEGDRETYWRERPQGHDWPSGLFQHAQRLAEAMIQGVEQLGEPDVRSDTLQLELESILPAMSEKFQKAREKLSQAGLTPDEINGFLKSWEQLLLDATQPGESQVLLRLVWEQARIAFVAKSLDQLERAAGGRILHLLSVLKQHAAKPKVMRYLQMVSRCFVYGFDAECVIMCRSALDVCLQEEVPDRLCELHKLEVKSPKQSISGGGKTYTIHQRIKAAQIDGLLSAKGKELISKVNEAAVPLVHQSAESCPPVLETIRNMIEAVAELTSPGNAGENSTKES